MSKRYIDADKIVITAERGISDNGLIFIPMCDVHQSIERTPTADVTEVRHGMWEINRIYGGNLIENFRCSSCGGVNRKDSNYCPYCGAKMDGGSDAHTSQEVRWNKNMEFLKSGGFGSMDGNECYTTLLRYWQAQEQAGYPKASENVKYFESLIGDSKK